MSAEVISIWGRAIRKANECERVNDVTVEEILRSMTDAELEAHVRSLQAEHTAKRHALYMSANALAKALNERANRR